PAPCGSAAGNGRRGWPGAGPGPPPGRSRPAPAGGGSPPPAPPAPPPPPPPRPHAPEQLADRERLAEVVVGAQVQALDPVGDGAGGGQHQDPRRAAPGDQAPAEL